MFKKGKNSLKKNMAILVCVAFVSVIIPEVTHAASRSSSTEFPFPQHIFSLFSPVFSTANHNISLAAYELAAMYILAKKTPLPNTPPNNADKTGDKNSKDAVESRGNSSSKKKPTDKD